jgi:large subunit ribosomal protein L1
MNIKEALAELRKEKKKFKQSVDLIVNLKGIDVKRDNIATVVSIPHKIKDKRVCGFFSEKTDAVRVITPPDFPKYKDKKTMKNLMKDFDFFIAEAPLMPSVATNFGKALGPTGKMPTPQLGILPKADNSMIKAVLEKINKSIKVRVKEASVKVIIGKEDMGDSEIQENIETFYKGLINALPTKQENVKSVMLKLTMSKPIKIEIK